MFIGAGEVKSLRHIARGGREGKGKRGGGEEGEEGEGIHSKLRRRRSDGRTDGGGGGVAERKTTTTESEISLWVCQASVPVRVRALVRPTPAGIPIPNKHTQFEKRSGTT